jgi:thymidylate synthase
MRIYTEPFEAFREVERELFEMGINVHPQTMQDKHVADDPDYMTKELQEYAFQITDWKFDMEHIRQAVAYTLWGDKSALVTADQYRELEGTMKYITNEFSDRISTTASNPGNSWYHRKWVWEQFLHNGKFAYTYSERLAPQWKGFYRELRERPETRQAILNLHTNICPIAIDKMESDDDPNLVYESNDAQNMGGSGRIPCSLYYQAIRREGKLHWIYAMRSCDYLVHFGVDVALAMMIQDHVARQLGIQAGPFTYFTGSLHAYHKELKTRGIF